MGSGAFGATLVLFAAIGGVILFLVWVLLPFAMFGIKPLLRRLIAEQERTARAIEALRPPADR